MRALAIVVKKPWFSEWSDKLSKFKFEELLAAGRQLGNHGSLSKVLRLPHVSSTIKDLSRRLHLVQRQVEYTNEYRCSLRSNFTSLRVWDGFAAMFWTINPADVNHELLLVFACGDVLQTQTYSLDWGDVEKTAYFNTKLPRLKLHEIVARDPLAAVLFLHTFIELCLEIVFCVRLFQLTA